MMQTKLCLNVCQSHDKVEDLKRSLSRRKMVKIVFVDVAA